MYMSILTIKTYINPNNMMSNSESRIEWFFLKIIFKKASVLGVNVMT